MPYNDFWILMAIGGLFVLLGLAAIIWGKREEKSYYDSLTNHSDLREYLEHWPQRPEPGALKVGGWIAITIGVLMLFAGGGLWLWG